MTISTVTYNTFVNRVKSYIQTRCDNFTNFGSIPSCFKSGYSVTYEADCADKSACVTYSAGATFTIANSSVITQVTTERLDSDMNSFLNTYCSAVNLDNPISQKNYLAFLQDMTCFCCAHCKYATSYFSTDTYLVYIPSAVYVHPPVLVSDSGYKFVQAIDVDYESKGLIDNIFNNSGDTNRQFNVYYSITTY